MTASDDKLRWEDILGPPPIKEYEGPWMWDKLRAFDSLVDVMADELNDSYSRKLEREAAFKKKPAKKTNYEKRQGPSAATPVKERIKRTYSAQGCPECEKRYGLFEETVLRGEDPTENQLLHRLCSAHIHQTHDSDEGKIKPVKGRKNM